MTDSVFYEVQRCNNKSMIIGALDDYQYGFLKSNSVFAHGEGHFPTIQNANIKWIAIKNDDDSWTIKYSDNIYTWDGIFHHGEKLKTEQNIRLLVPCEIEIFEMYGY